MAKTKILQLGLLLTIIYLVIKFKYRFDESSSLEYRSKSSNAMIPHFSQFDGSSHNGSTREKAELVIILSQIRFGSTFLGELFNKKANVSYFYEPVWNFPDDHMVDAVQVIDYLSRCRFDKLRAIYKKVYNSPSFQRNEWATYVYLHHT